VNRNSLRALGFATIFGAAVLAPTRVNAQDTQLTLPVTYNQHGRQWTERFRDNASINDVGCVICCIAMVHEYYGDHVNPNDVLQRLRDRKPSAIDSNDYVRWSLSSFNGVNFVHISTFDSIDEELNAGHPVIVEGFYHHHPQRPHWVLITGKSGGDYRIADPLGESDSLSAIYRSAPRDAVLRVVVYHSDGALTTGPPLGPPPSGTGRTRKRKRSLREWFTDEVGAISASLHRNKKISNANGHANSGMSHHKVAGASAHTTASTGEQLTIDETNSTSNGSVGFYRQGPLKYWHETSSFGNGGHMFWTYANTESEGVSNSAEWRPSIPANGNYEVQVFVPRNYGDTNDARYEVHAADGVHVIHIAQRNYNDEWVNLGTFPFDAGSSGFLRLGDVTNDPIRKSGRKRRWIAFDTARWIRQ